MGVGTIHLKTVNICIFSFQNNNTNSFQKHRRHISDFYETCHTSRFYENKITWRTPSCWRVGVNTSLMLSRSYTYWICVTSAIMQKGEKEKTRERKKRGGRGKQYPRFTGNWCITHFFYGKLGLSVMIFNAGIPVYKRYVAGNPYIG